MAKTLQIRENLVLSKALACFSQTSTQLVESYQDLQTHVERLEERLREKDSERLCELIQKEQLAEHLQGLLEIMPAGVVILDNHGLVKQANSETKAIFNGDISGRNWLDVINSYFRPQSNDGHEISLSNGKLVRLTTRALKEGAGQLIVLTDLTETRQLQNDLHKKEQLAQLGQMAASLAHQIRTPLSSAMLYASNLKNDRLNDDKRDQYINRMIERLHHLEKQINDMLLLVRGETGVLTATGISDLYHSIKKSIEDLPESAQIECQLDDSLSGQLINCNHDSLEGAIINLIENGLDASNPKGAVKVILDSRKEGYLTISVNDNGCGIEPELKQEMTRAFFSTKKKGTGLGLAVAKMVAKYHQGFLEIDSELGSGTSVLIAIPFEE